MVRPSPKFQENIRRHRATFLQNLVTIGRRTGSEVSRKRITEPLQSVAIGLIQSVRFKSIQNLNGPDNICETIIVVGQFGNVSTHFLKHSLHTQNTQYVLFVIRANGANDGIIPK